jgi:hypothetical protein
MQVMGWRRKPSTNAITYRGAVKYGGMKKAIITVLYIIYVNINCRHEKKFEVGQKK